MPLSGRNDGAGRSPADLTENLFRMNDTLQGAIGNEAVPIKSQRVVRYCQPVPATLGRVFAEHFALKSKK